MKTTQTKLNLGELAKWRILTAALVASSALAVPACFATFTPGEYTDNANTLGLYHLNQSSGTTIIDDNSVTGRTAHDGTINGPTPQTWAPGDFGNGLNSGSGTTSASTLLTSAVSTLGTAFTLEFYAKRDSASNGYDYSQLANIPAYLFVRGEGIFGDVINAGVNTSSGFAEVAAALTGQDSWHHIAVTVSESFGTSTIKLYFDGVLASSASGGTLNPALGEQPLYLGAFNPTDAYAYVGTFDEVRLSNIALTEFGMVPEPGSLALLSVGGLSLLAFRRHRSGW